LIQLAIDDNLVQTVQELRTEVIFHLIEHFVAHGIIRSLSWILLERGEIEA